MRINLISKVVIASGLSVVGVGLLTGTADAHHPLYGEDCNGIHASGTDYPSGSHVFFQVDGSTRLDKNFSPSFSDATGWNRDQSHTWVLVVTAPDHIGEVDWRGTQPACAPAQVTTVPTTAPTTTPTTVPLTTAPPTSPPATPAPTTVAPTTPTTEAITVPPDTTPPVDATTTIQPAPPTTECRNDVTVDNPLKPGETVCSLPVTGGDDGAQSLLVITGVGLALLGLTLYARTRRVEA